MDIPNLGTVQGEWDLRGRERSYLGNITVAGKRVLEVGTASGHLCFTMEKMGAEVVAYDLSDKQAWDIVPYAGFDYGEHIAQRKEHMRRINNGFWMAHRAYNSHAKMTYGTVYEVPDDVGQFDVCTFGSILLHLRDPFLALQRVSTHVKQAVIVTDVAPTAADISLLPGLRLVEFLPNAEKCNPTETWWRLHPELVSEYLRILGFVQTEISFHGQLYRGSEVELFTVVGQRQDATAAPRSSRGEESASEPPGENDRSALEERALRSMRFSHIARHLLRRGMGSVRRRLLSRT
jgi:hypothetical protein